MVDESTRSNDLAWQRRKESCRSWGLTSNRRVMNVVKKIVARRQDDDDGNVKWEEESCVE
jgi:hypothetical protein